VRNRQQVNSTLWRFAVAVVLFLALTSCVWALGERLRPPSSASAVFVAPKSGSSIKDYFGYDNGRVAIFGNQDVNYVVAFSHYAGRHENAALRWTADEETWGEAFSEVAEFVPTSQFLYNTGWYLGGHDTLYRPGDYGWDMTRDFGSISVRSCTIQTPDGLFDITSMIDPSLGEPYALSVVPWYSYHLHCEADMVDDDSGRLLFHFVHDQQWGPPMMTLDPLFHGKRIRPTIRQIESWRDSRQVITLYRSGASYARGLGCFWQTFSDGSAVAEQMLYSWAMRSSPLREPMIAPPSPRPKTSSPSFRHGPSTGTATNHQTRQRMNPEIRRRMNHEIHKIHEEEGAKERENW
jgi:hypothetical protein